MKIIAIIVGVIAVAGIGLLFLRPNSQSTQPQTQSPTIAPTITKQAASPSATVTESQNKTYTLAVVAKHNSKTDCWIVVNGNVYDVTQFVDRHPGGIAILKGCGKDATSLFEGVEKHQEKAVGMIGQFQIGTLQK